MSFFLGCQILREEASNTLPGEYIFGFSVEVIWEKKAEVLMFSKLSFNPYFQYRIPPSTVCNVSQSRDPLLSREYTSFFRWCGRGSSCLAEAGDQGSNLLIIPVLTVMLWSPSSKPNSSILRFATLKLGLWTPVVILPVILLASAHRGQQRETGRLGKQEGTRNFLFSFYCCEQHPTMFHWSKRSFPQQQLKSVCSFSNAHNQPHHALTPKTPVRV